jgi:transposase InsO family protein
LSSDEYTWINEAIDLNAFECCLHLQVQVCICFLLLSIRTYIKLRDELLNGEIFPTMTEAQIIIEQWRWEYNEVRPHSSLGYQPPAPEARMALSIT